MKHYLSDSGIWRVAAEFVNPDGKVMLSQGQAVVRVADDGRVTVDQTVRSEQIDRVNSYRVTPEPGGVMTTRSTDPCQPLLRGTFLVDRRNLFFRFRREGSAVNGYEIISRRRSVCYAYGALYDGTELKQTWSAVINKL